MAVEINQLYGSTKGPEKRVLFVITQSEMGGAQRFLTTLFSLLDRSQYRVKVLVGSDGGGELISKLRELQIETLVIPSLKRNINFSQDISAIRNIRKEILSFQPSTVFLNSSKAGFIGSLAARFPSRLKNIKVIYRIGGWTFNDPWKTPIKRLWIWLEKISASWKDIIIVNNTHDFDQATQLSIKPREKVVLIHNGIDPYKMTLLDKEQARQEIISRLSGIVPKKIIGTNANLYPAKGIEYFIKSARYFSEADDVVFVVWGDGPEKEQLTSLIKSEKLEKKVFLLGQIPDASQYLNAFDIFVLPSVKEGFPWAVLEAMSARVPVITTLVGAIPEIIEDGKNGVIIPVRRPDLIALKAKEIFQNENLRKELAIQAHQTILFKFSADKMVKAIESLF